VVQDGEAAQDDVAEERAAQVARRSHDPSHAELRPQLLGVARRIGPGADDLLQGDDVRLDAADDVGNAGRIGAPIEPAAAMDVVGGDAECPPVRVGGHSLAMALE
jgi:hypothetical protein